MNFDSEIQTRLEALAARNERRELAVSTGLSFTHNDYLGLSGHPRIAEAGKWALDVAGTGSRGSRLLGGHGRVFEETEARIARFFGSPDALFFSSGYLANLAIVPVAASLADHVVSDEKNHASLIDAIALARKPKTIVAHQRWDDLPEEIRRQRLLLVAESLYSMDGDLVDAAKLRALWDATDSFLVLDEAHAAGVLLADGSGVSRPWRDWSRMAVTVTFGKALGVAGAAILCTSAMKALLVNTARSFVYTTAPSPAVVAMVGAALDVCEDEAWRREELWERAVLVRNILREANGAGFHPAPEPSPDVWQERSPIIPFLVPGSDNALRFSGNMRESGVEMRAIRYPTVPRGGERVRISLNLTADRDNTERMAREVVRRWMAFSSQE